MLICSTVVFHAFATTVGFVLPNAQSLCHQVRLGPLMDSGIFLVQGLLMISFKNPERQHAAQVSQLAFGFLFVTGRRLPRESRFLAALCGHSVQLTLTEVSVWPLDLVSRIAFLVAMSFLFALSRRARKTGSLACHRAFFNVLMSLLGCSFIQWARAALSNA